MRTVAPKTSPRPDGDVLMPVDAVNENVMAWYGTVQLTGKSIYIHRDALLTLFKQLTISHNVNYLHLIRPTVVLSI